MSAEIKADRHVTESGEVYCPVEDDWVGISSGGDTGPSEGICSACNTILDDVRDPVLVGSLMWAATARIWKGSLLMLVLAVVIFTPSSVMAALTGSPW